VWQGLGWAGQRARLAANCGKSFSPKVASVEAMKNKKKKKEKEMYNQCEAAHTARGKQWQTIRE
jgi:hypothetical protein